MVEGVDALLVAWRERVKPATPLRDVSDSKIVAVLAALALLAALVLAFVFAHRSSSTDAVLLRDVTGVLAGGGSGGGGSAAQRRQQQLQLQLRQEHKRRKPSRSLSAPRRLPTRSLAERRAAKVEQTLAARAQRHGDDSADAPVSSSVALSLEERRRRQALRRDKLQSARVGSSGGSGGSAASAASRHRERVVSRTSLRANTAGAATANTATGRAAASFARAKDRVHARFLASHASVERDPAAAAAAAASSSSSPQSAAEMARDEARAARRARRAAEKQQKQQQPSADSDA